MSTIFFRSVWTKKLYAVIGRLGLGSWEMAWDSPSSSPDDDEDDEDEEE